MSLPLSSEERNSMKGLSIFSWFSYPLPLQERLELIKNAGFDATALWWVMNLKIKTASLK